MGLLSATCTCGIQCECSLNQKLQIHCLPKAFDGFIVLLANRNIGYFMLLNLFTKGIKGFQVKPFTCVSPILREGTLTWQTGCSTVCVKPGSRPPNTIWRTSRSSYQSFSICLSSCLTPTTSTWVSGGHCGQYQLIKVWLRTVGSININAMSTCCLMSQVPSRMAPSWVTSSSHHGPKVTPGSSSESTER